MKAVIIYLADLTHTGRCIASEQVPLNVALIGSYANKMFGENVRIRLFKFPEELLEAMEREAPDILGVSSYPWNSNLSEWACRKAKVISGNILTVRGGWDFPLDDVSRMEYFAQYPATDLFATHEGEGPFAAVLERFISSGREGVLSKAVDGCVHLDRGRSSPVLVVGDQVPRLFDLDGIPSPYTSGMLDDFLDGTFNPIVETTRGCPYTCNYCNSSIPFYARVRRFSLEYIRKDLEYLCDRLMDSGNKILMIPDANFGMFPQDRMVVELISEMRDRYDWPRVVYVVGSGKERMDKVLEALTPIRTEVAPSLAFQSLNPATLQEIGRKNIDIESFMSIAEEAEGLGFTIHSELIAPLPYETLKSYWDGFRTLIECGPQKITSYTLQMNRGTVYRERNYIEEHDILGKWRLVVNAFGEYDSEVILETELVAVSTSSFSFQDYLDVRCLTLYTEIFYNNGIFGEVLKLIEEYGFSAYHLMAMIHKEFPKTEGALLKVYNEFIYDTRDELKDTPEELERYVSTEPGWQNVMSGQVYGNVIFKYKTMVFSNCIAELADFAIDCARKLIVREGALLAGELEESLGMLKCIKSYCQCKLSDIFEEDRMDTPVLYTGEYDILQWISNEGGDGLGQYKREEARIGFEYNAERKSLKRSLFEQYGTDSVGRGRILAKVAILDSLFRQPFQIP